MSSVVLYIGGTGRSGSTILANLLGEADGYVSVGELRFLWERGLHEDRLCGCAEPFSQCPFWQTVLRSAFADDAPDPRHVMGLLHERTRLRRLPAVLSRGSGSRTMAPILSPLYRAVAEVSGAGVVVDSSKLPTYAALLDGLPELNVRMVHLVRDPRAAAFSWQRAKDLPDRAPRRTMERRGIVKSAALWAVWNAALEQLWRDRPEHYIRVAYEDLVDDPQRQLRRIVAAFDLGGSPWDALTGPRTAHLSVHHTVAGNPGRLQHGAQLLRADDEWASRMPTWQQAVVRSITAPVLRRSHHRPSQSLGAIA